MSSPAGLFNCNIKSDFREEKKGSPLSHPLFKKKHLAETLTIGFLAGVVTAIRMFKLVKK